MGIQRRAMMVLYVWERFNEPKDVRLPSTSTLICCFVIAVALDWLLLLRAWLFSPQNTNLSGRNLWELFPTSRVYLSTSRCCRIKIMFSPSSPGVLWTDNLRKTCSRAVKFRTLNLACLGFSLGNLSTIKIYIQPYTKTIHHFPKNAAKSSASRLPCEYRWCFLRAKRNGKSQRESQI